MASLMTDLATRRPWLITLMMVGGALLLAGLAAVPSVWPEAAPGLHAVRIDTDPENMLPTDDEVRVANEELRETFGAGPLLVVGIVDPTGPVTTPAVLEAVDELHDGMTNLIDIIEAAVSERSGSP